MGIRDWPSSERPRERLMLHGPGSLSDAELLAVLFRQGVRGKSALDLAREALLHHQGLRGLLTADFETFSQLPGLGLAAFSACQAVLELGRRCFAQNLARSPVVESSSSCRAYFASQLRDQTREVFAGLFLDTQHRVIRYEPLFQGTIHMADIHPRIILQKALQLNAAAVIVGHNHPSGSAEPSESDIHLTKELRKLLALVDVNLLDHIIVGEVGVVSLSDRGV